MNSNCQLILSGLPVSWLLLLQNTNDWLSVALLSQRCRRASAVFRGHTLDLCYGSRLTNDYRLITALNPRGCWIKTALTSSRGWHALVDVCWWLCISGCCIITWESIWHNTLCYLSIPVCVAVLATVSLWWKSVKFTYVKMCPSNSMFVLFFFSFFFTGWLHPLPTDRRCESFHTHIIHSQHIVTPFSCGTNS